MYLTPDLLVASFLILYISIIFKSNYSDSLIYGSLCGFIGALAYLSKSYAFSFFIVTFLLFNLIYYFKSFDEPQKKKIVKNLILGLSVFFVISGLWAGIISEKYDKITISTAGEYNQAIIGPDYPTHPAFYQGLYKPPNNISNSIWDDLSYIKVKKWSPFDSIDSSKRQLTILWENMSYTVHLIIVIFPIEIIVIITMLIFILKSKSNKISKERLIYLLTIIFIYSIGLCLIKIEWRYLFLIFILLMVSGFYIVDTLCKSKKITPTLRNILLIILVCSFIFHPIQKVIICSNENNPLFDLSKELKYDYNITGNIASNQWGETLIISYYLNAKYYGGTRETNSSIDLQKQLEENNIDYYFVWDNAKIPDLSNYKEITNGKIKGLMIYKRIKN
jgi:4-amino-4-deoxy-L-arabinose transferase-like glycosyltransferase